MLRQILADNSNNELQTPRVMHLNEIVPGMQSANLVTNVESAANVPDIPPAAVASTTCAPINRNESTRSATHLVNRDAHVESFISSPPATVNHEDGSAHDQQSTTSALLNFCRESLATVKELANSRINQTPRENTLTSAYAAEAAGSINQQPRDAIPHSQ